jgi:hypothetical protein
VEQAVETLWLSYLPEEIVQTSGTGKFDDTLIARGGEISTVPLRDWFLFPHANSH